MTEFLEFFRTKQVVYRWYLPQCLHTEGYFSTRAFDLQLPLHVKAVAPFGSSVSDTTRCLARFGLADHEVLDAAANGGPPPAGLPALLRFQAERAREQYGRAAGLLPAVDRKAMVPAEIMSAVYRATLEEVVKRGFPLGTARVALSRPRKAWIAARTLVRARRG